MLRKEFEGLKDEGTRGFQDLCKLAEELGYGGFPQQLSNNNGTYVSSLIHFLEDNPGAIRAIYDWVLDHYEEEVSEAEYLHSSVEECEESGDHMQDCDDDGFCNACGEQATCEHENTHVDECSQTVCDDCGEELGR